MQAKLGLLLAMLTVVAAPAWAQSAQEPLVGDKPASQSDLELAKKVQNPVGDLISLPILNNTNFNYGPHGGTQNVLNLQPVIPFHLSDDWNVITRTIVPVVWNPSLAPAPTTPVGTAPTSFSAFLAPSREVNGWLWGAGPVIQMPTISSSTLGSSLWGAGPSAAIVHSSGPWVAGALFNNIWSLGGTRGSDGKSYSTFLFNPFVTYNLDDGWYLSSSPNVTANWQIEGTKWTLPVGGGVGRFFHVGDQPIDLSLSAYYNVVRPDIAGQWQLSAQMTFIF